MKKVIPVILAVLVLTMSLSSCGSKECDSYSERDYSSHDDYSSNSDMNYPETVNYPEAEMSKDYSDDNSYNTDASVSNSYDAQSSDAKTTYTPVKQPKKIIKTANVDMTAKDVVSCYKDIINYCGRTSGYEFNKNMSSKGDYTTIQAQIKVDPQYLDDILDYISGCGTVINSNVESTDISTEYIDTQIRLENKKKNLAKYYDFYEKAENMDESLRLQDKIDDLTAEIESYEGQLNYWNSLVSESTINIYIVQEDSPVKIETKVDWSALSLSDLGTAIANGITKVGDKVLWILQCFLIFIISAMPVIALIAIILLIILIPAKIKKNKIKKANMAKETAKSQENVITEDTSIKEETPKEEITEVTEVKEEKSETTDTKTDTDKKE